MANGAALCHPTDSSHPASSPRLATMSPKESFGTHGLNKRLMKRGWRLNFRIWRSTSKSNHRSTLETYAPAREYAVSSRPYKSFFYYSIYYVKAVCRLKAIVKIAHDVLHKILHNVV